MRKLSFDRIVVFFISILIASSSGFYILGKAMAAKAENAELFSTPLLITIAMSASLGIFTIFRKKR